MSDEIKLVVREAYAEIARSDNNCCGAAGSLAVGYAQSDLASVPDGADLGVGCGNPLSFAMVKPGDVVLDLGSGGGIDCFLAARAVGPEGKAIGVDMTPEMITRARRNAEAMGYSNVEFRLGEIEALPVADEAVDLVISNCVINLVPDQPRVFAEAFRVLKPGGLLVVSDTLQTRPLPRAVLRSPAAKLACLSAETTREEYLANIRQAGFEQTSIMKDTPYPAHMAFEESLIKKLTEDLGVPPETVHEAANAMVSITVRAVKPR